MNAKKVKRRQVIILTLFALGFLIVASPSFAQTLQTNANLGFENIDISAEKISGKILIENNTGGALNNVALFLVLEEESRYVREKKDGPMILRSGQVIKNELIADSNGERFFNLLSGSSARRNFSISYPKSIPTGNYLLKASLYDIGGRSQAVTLRDIKISGKGEFLKIDPDDCKIFVGKDAFSPQDGPNFFKGEKPKISCKITNPNKSAITALPVFQTNELSLFRIASENSEEKIGESITLKPYETKTAEFTLLSDFDKPQVYETGFFLKASDGGQTSPYVLFRWIIKGAAARVSFVEFDKDGYFKNEIAEVSLKILQSPDLFWDYFPERAPKGGDANRYGGTPLNQLAVAVQIKNSRGSLCGSIIESYVYEEGVLDKTLEVPINKNCGDPAADIKIINGENVLSSAVFKSQSLPTTISALRKEAVKFWLIIVAVGLFIVGLILILKQKIKSGKFKTSF